MWNMLVMQPLAFIIRSIYNIVPSYGWAIIIFTILVKAILWPLTLKGQKSNMEMQRLQPQMQDLQEKYKGDKTKIAQETQKLYEKAGVKPLGGCLPQLIPMVFLLAMFWIVAQPITYILGLDVAEVHSELAILRDEHGVQMELGELSDYNMFRQVGLLSLARDHKIPSVEGFNFNFIGLDMATSPQDAMRNGFWPPYWILPILTGLATWYSSKVMYKGIDARKAEEEAQKSKKKKKKPEITEDGKVKPPDPTTQMQGFMKIMPFFSGWIAFQFPAALAVYQIISSGTQIAQQMYINKKMLPEPAGMGSEKK